MTDYKKTLSLPDTTFPMKANLRDKEPEMLKFWEQINAYGLMTSQTGQKGRYVLHDGPPYANGHIHMGTAMNKVLKDIVVKSRNMAGVKAEYVPGWDCHGLPIEHKVELELKKKKKDPPALTIRRLCREYAGKWLDTQRREFKRLGVFGAWDAPYLTMDPLYETATATELCNFMSKGSVLRGKKPIYWCSSCRTALAEAEVEYEDLASPSIYVRFPLPAEDLVALAPAAAGILEAYAVIWTTTPWTIPDNMAVAVHPEFEYAVVKVDNAAYVLASRLAAVCAEVFGWERPEVLALVPGSRLEGLKARHPFYDRESPLVLADYVTLEAGTGCVHTAPGHGREDFETGLRYGLEVLSPLDDHGRFLDSVEFFGGLNVFEANPRVVDKLRETGNLLAEESITHSYPHCWRCKRPVIFRATTQWFISMDNNGLREKSLEAIRNDVRWVPSWGEERIYNMVESRPDWCISRQRNWGVPIVALICQDCDRAYFEPEWVMDVVKRFKDHKNGCDYWFEADIADLAPEGLACPGCGAKNWRRETDILDVWFDSGTSYAAVSEQRPELRYPADLYLEGSDQHRGWFHSSLLAAMGTRGAPPFRTVVTHGYVVDGEGRKMSKSVGNVIAPQEIIDKYGAEILRMWVSAVNYQEDVRISDEILERLVDAYRRIRNTCRFLLGNLADFSPSRAVPAERLLPLDRFALDLAQDRHKGVQKAYEDFEFHKVYHGLHNLCVTDLSAFYLDIIKDRLYISAPDSVERRSAQTVLWQVLMMLLTDLAPVLSFTAEEAYGHLPQDLKTEAETVFALRFEPLDPLLTQAERKQWARLMALRGEVTKAIEPLRKQGVVGHSLNCELTLYAPDEVRGLLTTPAEVDLCELFIVSKVNLDRPENAPAQACASSEVQGLAMGIAVARGEKCPRCWRYSEQIGQDPSQAEVCPRCARVLAEIKDK